MRFSPELIPARLIDRPNRFITRVDISGKSEDSHLPDPGRLLELLVPGAELMVQPALPGSSRRTRFSTVLVKTGNIWVSLNSTLPNQLAAEWLEAGQLTMFQGWRILKCEVQSGRHRFDFLLENEAGPFYLEVKSVTWAKDGTGRFPDAVSSRGERHARALADMVQNGQPAGILFVAQREDIQRFMPFWDRDPVFCKTLIEAGRAGVNIWCVASQVSKKGVRFYREIPVYLAPL